MVAIDSHCSYKDASNDQKGEKRCRKNAAAYAAECITRNIFKTQNPQLTNKSGFKSRAAYNGTCMVAQI